MAADVTNFEEVPARVDSIEQKLDSLSASVDRRFTEVNARFDQVDKRFDEVDRRFEDVDRRFEEVSEHFVEQREYTEFAFERLRAGMVAGFARLERKLDQVIDGFNRPAQRRPRRSPKKR